MSTIVLRDGVIAADTARHLSEGNLRMPQDKYRRIMRLSDGSLVAGLGIKSQILDFARWCESDLRVKGWKDPYDPGVALERVRDYCQSRSPHKHQEMILLLYSNGQAVVYDGESDAFDITDCKFYAWGSGAAVALGALHMGASAAQAVSIAILYDPLTGGNVQVEVIENYPRAA